MYYLDSNVFILPALYTGEKAEAAIKYIENAISGDIQAGTCALTMDEVIWVVSRRASREEALELAANIMEFPNLRIHDVKRKDVSYAIDIMRGHPKIAPRDAIHISAAVNNGYPRIVSDDEDLWGIDVIQHVRLVDG
ncbi:MAG: type II toxin-antitoxin system VapC family toxin [Candidatus Thermoplasmatota archaeon]|nr:type II toxin-antitoxin system VapC family toxin [Candidatus Thermoplasmatota archaeon]